MIEIRVEHKGYEIIVDRMNSNRNWYIQVRHPDGGYVYDGYWPDSEHKTSGEAITEAKKGALLK